MFALDAGVPLREVQEAASHAGPRTTVIRGVDGPIRADVNVAVEPVSNGQGWHVTIRLGFHGHGIGKVLLPMVVRQARKEVPQSCQNLKKQLEAGVKRQDYTHRATRRLPSSAPRLRHPSRPGPTTERA